MPNVAVLNGKVTSHLSARWWAKGHLTVILVKMPLEIDSLTPKSHRTPGKMFLSSESTTRKTNRLWLGTCRLLLKSLQVSFVILIASTSTTEKREKEIWTWSHHLPVRWHCLGGLKPKISLQVSQPSTFRSTNLPQVKLLFTSILYQLLKLLNCSYRFILSSHNT